MLNFHKKILHLVFSDIALLCPTLSKRRWNRRINEIRQSDVTTDAISQKRDIVLKKYFCRLFLWSLSTTWHLIYVSKKSSWVVQKGDDLVKLVKLSKMTSQMTSLVQKETLYQKHILPKYSSGQYEELYFFF